MTLLYIALVFVFAIPWLHLHARNRAAQLKELTRLRELLQARSESPAAKILLETGSPYRDPAPREADPAALPQNQQDDHVDMQCATPRMAVDPAWEGGRCPGRAAYKCSSGNCAIHCNEHCGTECLRQSTRALNEAPGRAQGIS